MCHYFKRLVTAIILQSVLVIVICYLYIYLDFSYICCLFLLLP